MRARPTAPRTIPVLRAKQAEIRKSLAIEIGFRLSALRVRGSANDSRAFTVRSNGHKPVTDHPIDFDCDRTVIGRLGGKLFRNVANLDAEPRLDPKPAQPEVDGVHSSQPARKRRETMERAVFLLRACAAAREGGDPRVQNLIMRAESELARLRKREETR